MKTKAKKWIRFRIIFIAVILFAGFCIILARAYQFQVLERERLSAIARSCYTAIAKLPPKRGAILDRQGHELAVSVEVVSIYAHPNQIEKKEAASRALARALGLKYRQVKNSLNTPRAFVWIKRRVESSKAFEIKRLGIKGVGIEKDIRRYYPGKELAAHVLGFVGIDNKGLEGIERRYDRYLRGPETHLILMRDARGRPFLERYKAVGQGRPHSLVLTIDKDIQYKAQVALREVVIRKKAKSGICIVMEVKTGEILAMAVVPEFNPNVFHTYKPGIWRNRAVTDSFEPGSTLKAFLLAACIEEGVVSPYTRFFCEEGALEIYGHTINDTHRHEFLTVSDIISLSSNIGAVKMGLKLGYEQYYEYLKKFGFGQRTGIDLLGEATGYVRPSSKSKPIDQVSVYFGQGISVTALQLVRAMAAIANGGRLMRPFVMKEIMDEEGNVVKTQRPQVMARVLSRQTAYTVTKVLKRVVEPQGTGPKAAIPGYRVAGKTGTAQKVDPRTRRYSNKKHVASFVGYAPAGDPKIAIAVVIDEPKGIYYGGLVAGPVFRKVGQWALNHLQVIPEVQTVQAPERMASIKKPFHTPGREVKTHYQSTPSADSTPKAGLPDFTGMSMREVLRRCFSMGLKVVPRGSGFAFKQSPRPGTSLKRVKMVRVSFRPEG